MPGVLWRQEEDTKLMDAYGGKLKLTEMWVARHGGTEQGEMCCVFGRVGEGEICDVFLQVVIMCGLDQKKSQEQWEGAKDENIPSSSIVNGCLAQFPQEKHGKTQPVVPQ